MTILRISLQILLFFRLRDEEISKYLMYIMKKISTLESSYMDIKLLIYRSDILNLLKFHINLILHNSIALPATVIKKAYI